MKHINIYDSRINNTIDTYKIKNNSFQTKSQVYLKRNTTLFYSFDNFSLDPTRKLILVFQLTGKLQNLFW